MARAARDRAQEAVTARVLRAEAAAESLLLQAWLIRQYNCSTKIHTPPPVSFFEFNSVRNFQASDCADCEIRRDARAYARKKACRMAARIYFRARSEFGTYPPEVRTNTIAARVRDGAARTCAVVLGLCFQAFRKTPAFHAHIIRPAWAAGISVGTKPPPPRSVSAGFSMLGYVGTGEDEAGRYKRLVEAVTDYAIYMLDPDGVVTSWNAGAQRFKGYTPQEIIGQNFSCFYTEQDRKSGLPARALPPWPRLRAGRRYSRYRR